MELKLILEVINLIYPNQEPYENDKLSDYLNI